MYRFLLFFTLCFKASSSFDSYADCDASNCAEVNFGFTYCTRSLCKRIETVTIPLVVDQCKTDVYCFFTNDDERTFGFLTDSLTIVDSSTDSSCPHSLTTFVETATFLIQRLDNSIFVSPPAATSSPITESTTTATTHLARRLATTTTTTQSTASSTTKAIYSFGCLIESVEPVITWAKRLHMFVDDLNDLIAFIISSTITVSVYFAAKYSTKLRPASTETRQVVKSLIPRPVTQNQTKSKIRQASEALRTAETQASKSNASAITSTQANGSLAIEQQAQLPSSLAAQVTRQEAVSLAHTSDFVSTICEDTIRCNCLQDCSKDRYCVCRRNGLKCNPMCHKKQASTQNCINK